MNKEVIIDVYGRVQGVNFRSTIKNYCDSSGIKGYVMNDEEGSVHIIAQGEIEKLKGLITWLESNPGFSNVEGLKYRIENPTKSFDNFFVVKDKTFFKDQISAMTNLGKSLFGKTIVPLHVAIIPDGNRRWAKKKGMEEVKGHLKSGSYENIKSLFEESKRLGIKYLTVWGFSTENWKRSKKEVDVIFDLVTKDLEMFREEARENKIRFRHLGRKDRLPGKLLEEIEKLEEETKEYSELNVQLALDYGGRDEIMRAANKVLADGKNVEDENGFESYLDSRGIPDVDLIIRTGGEKRLSGFMPFQSPYAELYFTDIYFPDFGAEELRNAVEDFKSRDRRFGGNSK